MPRGRHEASLRGTLLRLREVHAAWNERRWQDYAALLDPRLQAFSAGDGNPEDKRCHLERMQGFCEDFPDARRQVDPYLDLLVSHDGRRSATLLRITGHTAGAQRLEAIGIFVFHWSAGRIITLRQFQCGPETLM